MTADSSNVSNSVPKKGGAFAPSALSWRMVFLVYTAIAILLVGYRYLDDLARERSGTFLMRLLEEGTGVYTFCLLLPPAFRLGRIYLFEHKGWLRLVGWHFAVAVAFSAAHTTLMAVSRHFLAPLLGLGPYDYGIMTYRYPMEFSNDLVAFSLIMTLYYFFERYRMAQAQQLAAAELQTKLVQAQLENLRLQLQPHFLFNTLNTISSVMYEDVRAADEMINQLSELLRLTLSGSRAHEIPLEEELQITRLYLDLMQKRYENKIQIHYAIDERLNNSLVPQLILQPLLENSLRHGMKAGGAAMELFVGAEQQNGSLVLRVADTGAGLETQESGAIFGKGLGLSNIKDRLTQLYGDKQGFTVANREGGGAEVSIRLPYHTAVVPNETGATVPCPTRE
jgi:two-component system LytT family sensor kinase